MLYRTLIASLMVGGAATLVPATAAASPTSANATSVSAQPDASKVMVGFPPPTDKRVTLANATQPNNLRWTSLNIDRLIPSRPIRRGSGPASDINGKPVSLEKLSFADGQGKNWRLADFVDAWNVDALVVMHRGRIVYEGYFSGMQATDRHVLNSCTKSMIGLLVATFADEGMIDLAQRTEHYLPELVGTPLGTATVQQLLDMEAHYRFGDLKTHESGIQVAFWQALGMSQRPKNYQGPNGLYEMLQTAQPISATRPSFRYDNGNTEALGWILRRVSGKPLDKLITERIWQHIGAEADAAILVDPTGAEVASAGLIATTRDLARFGELIRMQGKNHAGRQLLSRAAINRTFAGGDRDAFAAGARTEVVPGGSYKNQWWIPHDQEGGIFALGQFGQVVYVAPKSEVVIAQFASFPYPEQRNYSLLRAGYRGIVDLVIQRARSVSVQTSTSPK